MGLGLGSDPEAVLLQFHGGSLRSTLPCGSFLEVEDQLWLRGTMTNCGNEEKGVVMWGEGNRVVMSSGC